MPAEMLRPFIGREVTVEALRRRFEDARSGRGGVTLLVGDTGLGKSALVASLLRDIRTRGARVLIGRALVTEDPLPFSLVQAVIASASDDPAIRLDQDPPIGGDQFLIGFAYPMGRAKLPTPIGIEDRLLEVLGGSDNRGKSAPQRVLGDISARILELTRYGPTVIVLEDLDRADESSLTAIEFLANELRDRPLWILATCRPTDALSEHGGARIERFALDTGAERVLLQGMTSGDVAEFLRTEDPSREFSREQVVRLHSESSGNPLLLQLLGRQSAARDAASTPSGMATPPLDAESQRTLDLAAVLGPEFTFALLLRASGAEEERLAENLDQLTGRRIILERPGEHYEFPEERIRQTAYAGLSEESRRLLHQRAGEALESLGNPDPATIYALARHFYFGGLAGKSVRYNRSAAQIAQLALAPDVARDHLVRAWESQIELGETMPAGEAEIVLDLASVTEELGRLEDAEKTLRHFLERPGVRERLPPQTTAALEILLARVLTARGDLPGASALATKVLNSPGLKDFLPALIGAHHQLGQGLYYAAQYSEALAHHTEELRLAREIGNPLVIARAMGWRAASLAMMGQTTEAIAEAYAVTVARDRLGSPGESAQAHLFLGDILADARSPPSEREHALVELQEAIRFAEKAHEPRRIAWALYKSAELLREKGRWTEALDNVQRACGIFVQMGDRVGLSVAIKVRGQIAMDRGTYDLAEVDLLESRRLLGGLHHALEEIDVVLRLGQLYLARGDSADAQKCVVELEGWDLLKARPDLEAEFAQLKHQLAGKSG
ncbi:MAG: AAA family ATPase [Thermoplasmata archaeon]